MCSTLIGREDELCILEDALLEVVRGEGHMVILAGDAGVGKTRLASQLRRQAAKLNFTTLWGSCSESDLSLPYLPFLEAIANRLAGTDMDAVRRQLGRSGRELGHMFPQLGIDPCRRVARRPRAGEAAPL